MYYVKQDNYVYQITDHLGNVRATISDTKVSGSAVVLSYADYYPFGMTMAGRNMTTAPEYRLAYQGQEIDKEVGGAGFYAFELRHYDARLGKWLSADPYEQHWSPYLAMSNNPISFIDPDGGWSVFTYQQEYLQAQAEYMWNNMPAYSASTNDPWFMNSLRTVYQDGYRLGTVDAESFNAMMMTTGDVLTEHEAIVHNPRFDGRYNTISYYTFETFYRPSQVYGMVEDGLSQTPSETELKVIPMSPNGGTSITSFEFEHWRFVKAIKIAENNIADGLNLVNEYEGRLTDDMTFIANSTEVWADHIWKSDEHRPKLATYGSYEGRRTLDDADYSLILQLRYDANSVKELSPPQTITKEVYKESGGSEEYTLEQLIKIHGNAKDIIKADGGLTVTDKVGSEIKTYQKITYTTTVQELRADAHIIVTFKYKRRRILPENALRIENRQGGMSVGKIEFTKTTVTKD